MAAVGVTLGETPVAPSWGEVYIRIPPSQHCLSGQRQRVALRDIHPSGDVQSLYVPRATAWHGWMAHAAISRVGTATGMAESTRSGLTDQVGSDSGSRVTDSSGRSCLGDPVSWKDPL